MIVDLGMVHTGTPEGWWNQPRPAQVTSLAWAYARQGEASLDSCAPASARDGVFALHPPKAKKSSVNTLSALGIDD